MKKTNNFIDIPIVLPSNIYHKVEDYIDQSISLIDLESNKDFRMTICSLMLDSEEFEDFILTQLERRIIETRRDERTFNVYKTIVEDFLATIDNAREAMEKRYKNYMATFANKRVMDE